MLIDLNDLEDKSVGRLTPEQKRNGIIALQESVNRSNMKEEWSLAFIGPICIGIETIISKTDNSKYSKMILNTILPETDEEYEQKKEEIEGRMQTICDLWNNLKNGQSFI